MSTDHLSKHDARNSTSGEVSLTGCCDCELNGVGTLRGALAATRLWYPYHRLSRQSCGNVTT